mgnify:CR=1 FL=1
MPTNYRSFATEVGRFPRVLDTVAIRIARSTVVLAYRYMAPLMPVKTGKLRGNLQITTRAPAQRILARRAVGAAGVPSKTDEPFLQQELAKFGRGLQPYTNLFLGSSVPYGTYVNDGTDQFFGYHWVEATQAFLQGVAFTQQDLGFAAFPDIATQLGATAGRDV